VTVGVIGTACALEMSGPGRQGWQNGAFPIVRLRNVSSGLFVKEGKFGWRALNFGGAWVDFETCEERTSMSDASPPSLTCLGPPLPSNEIRGALRRNFCDQCVVAGLRRAISTPRVWPSGSVFLRECLLPSG